VVAAATAPALAIAPLPFTHPHLCSPLPSTFVRPLPSTCLCLCNSSVSLPPLVPVPLLAHLCLFMPAQLCWFPLGSAHPCSSVLVPTSPHLFVLVPTCLCLLGCVYICADPHYPVTLVWPSFGLHLCLFVLFCTRLFACSFMRIPATLLLPCYTHLAFICAHLCSSGLWLVPLCSLTSRLCP
jgi:hypothetical protein